MATPKATFKYFAIFALPQEKRRKTVDYVIEATNGGELGKLEFYPPWRRHVLAPAPGTVWSRDCLADVRAFLATL